MGRLNGKRVAIVVTDGFEQVEMTEPRRALEEEGAETELVSPKTDEVRGWNYTEWGDSFEVETPIDEADAGDYDALLLSGGVMNPDKLRVMPEVQAFVREFFEAGKPVAAICHGPWELVDAGVARGRTMTAWPSIRSDLANAGANVVDHEAVVDGNLITSRKPDDIPMFNREMISLFERGPVLQMPEEARP